MPEYLAPGVYIEEVSTGPRPIEGVSTSTSGFVGETERGPTHPVLVTSWQNYYQWFGGKVARTPGTPNISCRTRCAGSSTTEASECLWLASLGPTPRSPGET